MKVLYLECNMGAAGDMLMASLYELLNERQKSEFLETMNRLSDEIEVRAAAAQTCGIAGTRMEVLMHGQDEETMMDAAAQEYVHRREHPQQHEHLHDHDHPQEHAHPHNHGHSHHHAHTAPAQVSAIITALPVPEEVKKHAQAVYDSIAAAESHAHGMPVEQIHFHEVGSLDAVADVTGVSLALHMLHPDRIVTSPIHLGSGEVRCAHGVLPVPTPATAYLLQGIPCYTGEIRGELCTPTGAALLAHFSESFGPMPVMSPEQIGYGIGRRVFPAANCVRAYLGTVYERQQDEVVELCCNIDDMTAEGMAFAAERLMELGALDTTLAPVTMKKGRPGTVLTVLCRSSDETRMAQAVLRETTSNGVRVRRCDRHLLRQSVRTIETPYGAARMKGAQGDGIRHTKPEYEDAARIARQTGEPFGTVWGNIMDADRTGDQ